MWSNPWRFDSSRRHRTFNFFFDKISILHRRSSQDGHGTGLKNLGYWFESNLRHIARVVQLVERLLAKEKVAGSSPVSRSKKCRCGETGIHARLKILCSQQAWGFDSLLRHPIGDWRNWLACMVWDHEVAGSNPVSPTKSAGIV